MFNLSDGFIILWWLYIVYWFIQDPPSPTPPRKKSSKPEKKAPKEEDKEFKWSLENDRFVTVSEFKGRVMVGIREFYMDKGSGELKPGKKGISLNPKQWGKLKAAVKDIDEAVEKLSA